MVVGGFAELGEDGAVYNSAAVFGPAGLLAVYRKTHLWDREKLCFAPGSRAGACRRDAVRPDRRGGLLRPLLPGAHARARSRRRRSDRRPGEPPALPAPGGRAAGGDRARPGDRAREQGLGRGLRPRRAGARRRVDGRELHRRPGRLARGRPGRRLRRGDPRTRTATSLWRGRRRGASGTTSSATCGRSSTRPRGPRATPRVSPPRASAARAGRPPPAPPEPRDRGRARARGPARARRPP